MITFKGQQTTMSGRVFRTTSCGIKVSTVLNTNGCGFWSDVARAVKINGLSLAYIDDEVEFAELQVFFNRNTWSTERHGLIYTDSKFEKELKAFLKQIGFVANSVNYSEQGMQGDNYVSFDVGKRFINSWIKIVYNGDREKFIKDSNRS